MNSNSRAVGEWVGYFYGPKTHCMRGGHLSTKCVANDQGGVSLMKEAIMVELDHNVNCIGNDACCRKSCRIVLNPSSDCNDGKAYCKRGQ